MEMKFKAYKTKFFNAQTGVSPELLKQIRATSKNPYIYAYIVLHEGIVTPYNRETGEGFTVYFDNRAVKEGLSKIQIGSPVYHGHTESDLEYVYEPGIARVIGKQMVDGKVIVILHGNKELDKMNAISAEMNLDIDEKGTVIAVNEITAYALLDYEAPAFSGATKVLKVAASEPSTTQQPLTFDAVKSAVRALNIFPWQLYSEQELFSDKVISEKMNKLEIQNRQQTDELSQLRTTVLTIEMKTKVADTIKNHQSLNDAQKAFVQYQADKTDLSQIQDVNQFIDTAVNEYEQYSKMFTVSANPVQQQVNQVNQVQQPNQPMNPNLPPLSNPLEQKNVRDSQSVEDVAFDMLIDST